MPSGAPEDAVGMGRRWRQYYNSPNKDSPMVSESAVIMFKVPTGVDIFQDVC